VQFNIVIRDVCASPAMASPLAELSSAPTSCPRGEQAFPWFTKKHTASPIGPFVAVLAVVRQNAWAESKGSVPWRNSVSSGQLDIAFLNGKRGNLARSTDAIRALQYCSGTKGETPPYSSTHGPLITPCTTPESSLSEGAATWKIKPISLPYTTIHLYPLPLDWRS
jgi:hypothetical protein